MKSGTINDITKLHFYTDKGYEIPMKKSYILSWEFVPGETVSKYVKTAPTGYFIGDVDMSDSTNIKVKSLTLMAGLINAGEFYARYEKLNGIDENGKPIFSYELPATSDEYYSYLTDLFFDSENQIKISINTGAETISFSYDPGSVFSTDIIANNADDFINTKKICTGSNIDNLNEYYVLVSLKQIFDLSFNETEQKAFVEIIFENTITNLGLYFPFIRYQSDFYQDPISTDFLDVNTLIVLEEGLVSVEHPDGTITEETVYVKPCINSESNYSLSFKPTEDSELRLISADTEYEVKYKDEISFYMADAEIDEEPSSVISYADYIKSADPFTLTFAVTAAEEGAYLNFLGIYMKAYDNNDEPHLFFMGVIVVKTEVIGEDERFRTLLGNFGVPDPIKYPNIFAEQDYQEEGKDFELINRKSKELMLTYSEIFSYVGTYKALLKAIKFLGYNDIIFKEWYTLMDSNDHETDIAVQVYDTSTGEMLKLKLAAYGVSIEDFKKYNKINKLSMIYHMNEEDDDNYEYLQTYLTHYDAQELKMIVEGKYTKLSEVPLTKPIYEYRNEEITAKLFAVKHWLETNIIGVNAYIADITGEGIYFGWEKAQGYSTLHALVDYSAEQYYTPDVKYTTPLVNSEAKISCTLTELNNSVKICEYENLPFNAFIKGEKQLDASTDNIGSDTSVLYVSNSFEAPVLGDEYEFELNVTPKTGTLYEWSEDSSSQIYINDGEISLLFENYNSANIKSDSLPIISLENANIHKCYGKWEENIEWTVREVIDQTTGNTQYKFKNYGTYRSDSYAIYKNDYLTLVPDKNAKLTYTEVNNWQVPMFIISGYRLYNVNIDPAKEKQYNISDGDFVLEILKGDMYFKEINGIGAQLSFTNDRNYVQTNNKVNGTVIDTMEQEIGIQYVYKTDRKQFIELNLKEIEKPVTVDTTDIDDNIEHSQNTIDEFYDDIVDSILKYTTSTRYDSAAIEEAQDYISSNASFLEANQEFLDVKREQDIKKALYEEQIKAYNDNYVFNKTIDACVNRVGKYNVIVKAYDKYNNMFVNKYDKQATINGHPLNIDLYVDQNNSNNTEDFYRFNKDGELMSALDISAAIADTSVDPLFPKNYHIYDFDYDMENNCIQFNNISYAIDTPKNGNYVMLDNYTELCTHAKKINVFGLWQLSMLDSNPDRLLLYRVANKIAICIYDTILQKDYACLDGWTVTYQILYAPTKNELQSSRSALYLTHPSYKKYTQNYDAFLDIINDTNRYKTYVINTTEWPVTAVGNSSTYHVHEGDIENKRTSIRVALKKRVFNVGDVVKIRYYITETVGTENETIINETAYRIIDIKECDQSVSGTTYAYDYIIDGLINVEMLYDQNITVKMTRAHRAPIHYMARVLGDAREFNYSIDEEGNCIIKDYFNYNAKPLFLNDYLDDNFAGSIYDYDANNLRKIWFNPKTIIAPDDAEMFKYCNYPVTVPQGKYLIFNHHNNGTLTDGYHVSWRWLNDTFDETDNLEFYQRNYTKEVLFRSVNGKLAVMPEYLGVQDIELTCVDKFGNRIINKGEGLLNVIAKDDYTPNILGNDNDLITSEDIDNANDIL